MEQVQKLVTGGENSATNIGRGGGGGIAMKTLNKEHIHEWKLNEIWERTKSYAYSMDKYIYHTYIFICTRGCGEVKVQKVEL